MTEADRRYKELIDSLLELAASLIRNGADPDAVQTFVDAQLIRYEERRDS
jgi:hypothetical protein